MIQVLISNKKSNLYLYKDILHTGECILLIYAPNKIFEILSSEYFYLAYAEVHTCSEY